MIMIIINTEIINDKFKNKYKNNIRIMLFTFNLLWKQLLENVPNCKKKNLQESRTHDLSESRSFITTKPYGVFQAYHRDFMYLNTRINIKIICRIVLLMFPVFVLIIFGFVCHLLQVFCNKIDGIFKIP